MPSLRRLSRAADIGRESVRQYLKGERLPTDKNMAKLLRGLGVAGTPWGDRLQEALKKARIPIGQATENDIVDELTDLFFEHANRNRTTSLEMDIKRAVTRIVAGGK
mgnify:CR=1 FL=1|tara:strand:+ start:437 stop:757 length:321 start_codon:yes stop_codon:yes gene_type:complete